MGSDSPLVQEWERTAAEYAAMSEEARQKALSQWYTSLDVADILAAQVWKHKPKTLLEPAAGMGSLIVVQDPSIRVTAYELDRERHAAALEAIAPKIEIRYEDFLKCPRGERFDVACLNPPFENNQDIRFVYKCFKRCRIVVALLRVQFTHRTAADEMFFQPCKPWISDYKALHPRPKFGGEYNPMDEYVIVEFRQPEDRPPGVKDCIDRVRWKK